MKRVLFLLFSLNLVGCFSSSTPTIHEPVQRQIIPKTGDISASPVLDIEAKDPPMQKTKNGANDSAAGTPAAVIDADSDCKQSEYLPAVPSFVESLHVVVTRINQPCRIDATTTGYQPDSSWMAMGFPCTAGQGEITLRGKTYQPKMVVYKLENDCPMVPANPVELRNRVATLKDKFLRPDKLLALTPFSLLYWESVEFADAGFGPSVGMLSPAYLKQGWANFRSGEALNFRLYGQENAWVTDKKFFVAEVGFVADGKQKFAIKLNSVTVMDDVELKKLRHRCEALHSKLACSALEY